MWRIRVTVQGCSIELILTGYKRRCCTLKDILLGIFVAMVCLAIVAPYYSLLNLCDLGKIADKIGEGVSALKDIAMELRYIRQEMKKRRDNQ